MGEFLATLFWLAVVYSVVMYVLVFIVAIGTTDDARRGVEPASAARTAWSALPWAPLAVPLWIIAQRSAVLREDGDDG